MHDEIALTGTSWRDAVKQVAYRATLREACERWEIEDPVVNYRWTHVQAVVVLVKRLAAIEGADPDIAEAAAWLHDCEKRGRNDHHGENGSLTAREVLQGTDFPQDKVEAVVDVIAQHVGLWREEPLDSVEAAILWDADKLSKLGVGSQLQEIAIWSVTQRGDLAALVESAISQDWQDKTVASFHTEAAREAGRARLAEQRAFWEQVARELAGDDLPAGVEPA